MTTDVSSSPRVGSAIDSLIDDRVEVGEKRVAIDRWPEVDRGGNYRPRNETPRGDRP